MRGDVGARCLAGWQRALRKRAQLRPRVIGLVKGRPLVRDEKDGAFGGLPLGDVARLRELLVGHHAVQRQ